MTEHAMEVLLYCGASVASLGLLCLFASINADSNFMHFVDAWKAKRLAELSVKQQELELKKVQAQHERMCPRLTDTPRTR